MSRAVLSVILSELRSIRVREGGKRVSSNEEGCDGLHSVFGPGS